MPKIMYRKRNGGWEYRFEIARLNGKRQHLSKSGFKTKKEAELAGNKAYLDYNTTGLNFIPTEMSVSDYFDFWLKEYCKVNLKPDTVIGYTKKINNHIKPNVGYYALKAINSATLQKLINNLFNLGYSRNTLLSIKGILTSAFNYAVEPLGFIANNPALAIKLPLKNAQPDTPTRIGERHIISKEDMAKILERFPEGSTAYIPLLFGYRCGMRMGEAFAVTWDCVDFEKKTIIINKQVQWQEKDKNNTLSESYWYITAPKYGSVRIIDVDIETINVLKREKERQTLDKQKYGNLYTHNYCTNDNIKRINTESGELIDFVTVRENGEFIQPRIMQHTTAIITKKLGIKFNFHSLRHTHCTMLAENNAPIKYVQQRLGHKNVTVTLQIYQHVSEKMSEEGRIALNNIYDINENVKGNKIT